MDKAEDAVGKKADEMVKTLEDHGGKIDKSKGNHKGHDEERKRDFDRCKDDDDKVPMYLLNADGSVKALHTDGSTSDVSKTDSQVSGASSKRTAPSGGRPPGETRLQPTHQP